MPTITFERLKPTEIAGLFTTENERNWILSEYLVINSFGVKKMDTCKKFTEAYANNYGIYRLFSGSNSCFLEESLKEFQIEEVDKRFAAAGLLQGQVYFQINSGKAVLLESFEDFTCSLKDNTPIYSLASK